MKHSSKPYNPKLAGVFFKSGMIEAWEKDLTKIREACAKYDAQLPEYNITHQGFRCFVRRVINIWNDDHHDQNGHDVVML